MAAAVYTTSDISAPHAAQEHFGENFDLGAPVAAASDYSRYVPAPLPLPMDVADSPPSLMHTHTKHQLDLARRMAERRRPAPPDVSATPGLGTSTGGTSSQSSVDTQAL